MAYKGLNGGAGRAFDTFVAAVKFWLFYEFAYDGNVLYSLVSVTCLAVYQDIIIRHNVERMKR